MREGEKRSRPFARKLRKEMTDAEIWLWAKLRRPPDSSLKFRRQHPIGPYIADFACVARRLVVEIDGATHGTDAEIAHDTVRTAHLMSEGWRVIRFTNDEVYRDPDGVVDLIWRSLS